MTDQIQQMRSLVQQHVDLIISTLGSPTALNSVIDQAAKADIPVISLLGQSTDKNAVNLQPNPIQLGYFGAKGLVTAMGGKGSVLVVDGIPGLSIDTGILQGGEAVLKACHINIVGTVVGKFDPTIAKTQVLQFLSAHPGTIHGVFQVVRHGAGDLQRVRAGRARRCRRSTTSARRPSSLAYWKANASKGYKGSGVAIPAIKDGTYSIATALAMLEGRGVKITDVPYSPPVITDREPQPVGQARLDDQHQRAVGRPAERGPDHRAAQHVLRQEVAASTGRAPGSLAGRRRPAAASVHSDED